MQDICMRLRKEKFSSCRRADITESTSGLVSAELTQGRETASASWLWASWQRHTGVHRALRSSACPAPSLPALGSDLASPLQDFAKLRNTQNSEPGY